MINIFMKNTLTIIKFDRLREAISKALKKITPQNIRISSYETSSNILSSLNAYLKDNEKNVSR